MDRLYAAWDAYQAHSTADTLRTWLTAATAVLSAGGTLPDAMAGTYRLATGAQALPPVTVTATNWTPTLVLAGLAWWASR